MPLVWILAGNNMIAPFHFSFFLRFTGNIASQISHVLLIQTQKIALGLSGYLLKLFEDQGLSMLAPENPLAFSSSHGDPCWTLGIYRNHWAKTWQRVSATICFFKHIVMYILYSGIKLIFLPGLIRQISADSTICWVFSSDSQFFQFTQQCCIHFSSPWVRNHPSDW